MKIIKKGVMPNGTKIQIEDWHDDYPTIFLTNACVAAYPIAKESRLVPGCFSYCYPHIGKPFRLDFHFDSAFAAEQAFQALESGEKSFKDFAEFAWDMSLLRFA